MVEAVVVKKKSYNVKTSKRQSGARSLHGLSDFAIVGQARRLPRIGKRGAFPTATSAG
jgi:hypothetical protein